MGEEINKMMDMLRQMQESMKEGQETMNARLERLEGKKENPLAGGRSGSESRDNMLEDDKEVVRHIEMIATGREKQITKTFGEDPSADALLEFLEHYRLCVEINQQKKVPGWNDASYRAKELRCQLQGEAATYVRQEEAMHESWVNDDNEIMERLRQRWVNRDCIELDIIEFEEARQGDMETLAQYMTRLKGLGQRAFGEFDPRGMQQCIIWRFLDGVKDRDVRSSIIRERWMVDRTTPKSYDEVLKIGENALIVKIASKATGALGNHNPKSASPGVASVSVYKSMPGPGSDRGKGNKSRGGGGPLRTSTPSLPPRGFECFYCKERHPGGWRNCEKRRRENPGWTPQYRKDGSSTSSSNPTTPEEQSPISPPSTNSSNQSF